jgi:outer membrane receptor protein involved in Fe transport
MLDWAITDDVRLRGGYQRAVRAPNITELYTPQQFGLVGLNDPCATASGTGTPAASLAACQNTGMTATQYGHTTSCSAAQCSGLGGGNTHLKPEEANTYTYGVVFTPTFLRGFTATVDYFDITIANKIGSVPASASLETCLANGASPLCANIKRDPLNGEITDGGYIVTALANIGTFHTKGIDYEANYHIDLAQMGLGDHGSLVFHDVGTILTLYQNTSIQGVTAPYDCAGYFGTTCGTPNPKLRNVFRATWVTPWNASFSVQWRYFGAVNLDLDSTNVALNPGGPIGDTVEPRIPAYNWIDLSGTWKFHDGYNLRFGVSNVFDKDPPILDSSNIGIASPPFGNGNTYPQVYDTLGRTFFVGITADF